MKNLRIPMLAALSFLVACGGAELDSEESLSSNESELRLSRTMVEQYNDASNDKRSGSRITLRYQQAEAVQLAIAIQWMADGGDRPANEARQMVMDLARAAAVQGGKLQGYLLLDRKAAAVFNSLAKRYQVNSYVTFRSL